MKALSIKNPHAYKLISGLKTLAEDEAFSLENPLVEWRSWETHHRGALCICASATPKFGHLFSGHALGVANLFDCRKLRVPGSRQWAWAWLFNKVCPFLTPIQVRGTMGLFNVPCENWQKGHRIVEVHRSRRGKVRTKDAEPIPFVGSFEDVEKFWRQAGVEARRTDAAGFAADPNDFRDIAAYELLNGEARYIVLGQPRV